MDLFLKDWLNNSYYWFSPDHKYDTYLTNTYGKHLEEEWDKSNKDIYYHLGKLIIYDQIARHKYRNRQLLIDHFLEKALEIYYYIRKEFDISKFSSLEWVFYVLPIRHNGNTQEIFHIIGEAWVRLKKETDKNQEQHLINFLKASYSRCSVNELKFIEQHNHYENKYKFENFTDYLDILGFCPLKHYGNGVDSIMYKIYKEFIKKYNIQHLIISVSGGVDSQVTNYVLKMLQDKYNFSLTAVYINYSNRTVREYEFVKDWCHYMNIPLYVRHITEIQRKPCMEYGMRTLYEDYTKTVRFSTYKLVWTEILKYDGYPQVVLGHNEDDCFENILTNICHKSKYENLRGMIEKQVIDNVLFYRPLLNIPKQSIYYYAENVGIPYLQDSTPGWSQRGKIRDHVRPCLTNWNSDIITSIFELSSRVQDYEIILNMYVKNIIKQLVYKDNKISLEIEERDIYYSKLVWEKLFNYLTIACTYKSLNNFMEILSKHKNYKKININKNTVITMHDLGDKISIMIENI